LLVAETKLFQRILMCGMSMHLGNFQVIKNEFSNTVMVESP